MEAIKQSVDSGVIVFLVSSMLGIALLFLIIAVGNKSIATNETFKVRSDTSSYTCVISETDNDLSLNCLKIK
jgi:hypothetical protein